MPDTKLEVARYGEFGSDEQWWYSQWYISDTSRTLLGWLLTHHDLFWYWLALGDDKDFDDPSVGRWIIEKP